MSQLPQTVRIKRKAQDEPVESLFVQTQHDRRKRRVTEPASFFRRVKDDVDPAAGPSASSAGQTPTQVPSSSRSVEQKTLQPSTPRHFHLSKPSVSTSSPSSRKRRNVATLMETRSKKAKDAGDQPETSVAGESVASKPESDDEMQIDRPSTPPLKRPGRASRLTTKGSRDTQSQEKTAVASSNTTPPTSATGVTGPAPAPSQALNSHETGQAPTVTSPEDANLLLQMQKFAAEVEEQETQEREPPAQPPRTPQPLKFQPKVPSQRYSERHPRHESKLPVDEHSTNMDIDTGDESDVDYVYDTYIRHEGVPEPPGEGATTNIDTNVGILIVRAEDEELWESYLVESDDSDKDWNSEDEDENAEDFYANEYPEEEVASDDEVGTGAYNYRAGASDDEEYGLSDEGEDMKRPWGRYPWLSGRKHYAAEEDSDGASSD